METSPVLVLGGGLAGLSAAYHLHGECELFEKEPYIGGHSRTKRVDGFNFDEGAHVFFGKGECADAFVWRPLGEELITHQAEIWNHYEGRRFGRYPVQANAHALDPELATRCVVDFIAVHNQPESETRNYEEWCYASFGRTFSDEFMLRYARKIWTVEPSELNTDWLGSNVGRRISRPNLEQVLRGAIDPDPQNINYLTQFSYPASGGFGRITEPLAAGVPHLRLNCGVERIEGEARRITFTDGSVRQYETAISTIPLPSLVRMAVDCPAAVREAAERLMWNSIRCVNLGVARADIGPGHWVYFYDHAIPFFRVSFPSKFAPSNAPDGHSSITCEIAHSRRKPLDEENLTTRVIEALRSTGILEPTDEITVVDQMEVPYAYVVFDHHRQQSVDKVHGWMESVGLYPCGRFGEWGYHWSFEAIESGRRVARRVAAEHQLKVR